MKTIPDRDTSIGPSFSPLSLLGTEGYIYDPYNPDSPNYDDTTQRFFLLIESSPERFLLIDTDQKLIVQ